MNNKINKFLRIFTENLSKKEFKERYKSKKLPFKIFFSQKTHSEFINELSHKKLKIQDIQKDFMEFKTHKSFCKFIDDLENKEIKILWFNDELSYDQPYSFDGIFSRLCIKGLGRKLNTRV